MYVCFVRPNMGRMWKHIKMYERVIILVNFGEIAPFDCALLHDEFNRASC